MFSFLSCEFCPAVLVVSSFCLHNITTVYYISSHLFSPLIICFASQNLCIGFWWYRKVTGHIFLLSGCLLSTTQDFYKIDITFSSWNHLLILLWSLWLSTFFWHLFWTFAVGSSCLFIDKWDERWWRLNRLLYSVRVLIPFLQSGRSLTSSSCQITDSKSSNVSFPIVSITMMKIYYNNVLNESCPHQSINIILNLN